MCGIGDRARRHSVFAAMTYGLFALKNTKPVSSNRKRKGRKNCILLCSYHLTLTRESASAMSLAALLWLIHEGYLLRLYVNVEINVRIQKARFYGV